MIISNLLTKPQSFYSVLTTAYESQMRAYDLGRLFSLPVQAAIKAQAIAVREAMSFVEEFGIENGQIKTYPLTVERYVEETYKSPSGETMTHLVHKPFLMQVPVLSLVHPPFIQIREIKVDFGVEITSTSSQAISSDIVQSEKADRSLANTKGIYTPPDAPNPTTMKVTMMVEKEIPEGLARIYDVLNDLITAFPTKTDKPKKGDWPVIVIEGIGKTYSQRLASGEIKYVNQLAIADSKYIANIAQVNEKEAQSWIDMAKFKMLNSLSEEDAEGLIQISNIRSLEDLIQANPEKLYNLIMEAVEARKLEVPDDYVLTLNRVKNWIFEAKLLLEN